MAKASKKPTATTAATTAPAVDQTTEQTTEQAAPVAAVQLTIADLQLLGRVIDLASRRGAFQGNELTQVGASYDKLTGFLAYVESTQAPAETDSETEAAAVEA